MRSGTHGFGVGITTSTGVPSPSRTALRGRALRVEPDRHEDRAPLRVEVQDLGGVGREEEPVLGSPTCRRRPRRP